MVETSHKGHITALEFSKNGRFIVSGDKFGNIKINDILMQSEISLEGHKNQINQISFA